VTGRFEGKRCLVTGSTGLAAAAALGMAAEGGRVFVVSRDASHARALAEEVGGGWHAADLAVETEAEAGVAAAVSALGGLDAVYNVAGISGRRFGDGPVHEASLAGWEAVIAANLTSMFLVCRAAVRVMRAQEPPGGAILNMSSQLARHPSPEHFATHAYAASKGGIEALTRAMAASYAADGIRVNAIAPALVATPMSRRAQDDPAIVAYLSAKQPLAHGPMQPDDVTPTALHLLSDDARLITGQVVAVDAGWSVSGG
jgi:NAD(P)-dependent dehydrogenase (short-subunit alcohol dehydrogenase family)